MKSKFSKEYIEARTALEKRAAAVREAANPGETGLILNKRILWDSKAGEPRISIQGPCSEAKVRALHAPEYANFLKAVRSEVKRQTKD